MIELKNINKIYKSKGQEFQALKNINLVFGDKGMNFILGKSGSGKSTLLNVIGGIDSYDSGELIIDGVNTKEYTKTDYNTYRNTYIGFIFQEFNVLKSLTVYENIALSLELQHKNLNEESEKIQEIIDKVGLTGLENRMMNQLSGGQRQRVAIARSLIKNPRVIIADEPTGNLDSKNSKNIMDLLKELAVDHLVIVVTHNDQLAKEYSDRTIEIRDGVVTKDNVEVMPESTTYDLEPISVPIQTSLKLSIKSIFKNLKRFIFMILLFAISLVFAGVVINMYLADTTMIYAQYQQEYNNNVVDLSSNFSSRGFNLNTAFYEYQLADFDKNYVNENSSFIKIRAMDFNLPIDDNAVVENEFYLNKVQRIHFLTDAITLHLVMGRPKYEKSIPYEQRHLIQIGITDYLAENLIYQNYFGSKVKTEKDLLGQTLKFDNFNTEFIISKIFDTKYEDYKKYFPLFTNGNSDPKGQSAFYDNVLLYNSFIICSDTEKSKLLDYTNINYIETDAIYSMVGSTGQGTGLKVQIYDKDHGKLKPTNKSASDPIPSAEGQPIQVAVSTGFFEKFLNIKIDESEIEPGKNICDAYFEKIYYGIPYYVEGSSDPIYKDIFSSCFLCFTSYVPVNFTFEIRTVIEDDEPILYTAPIIEGEKETFKNIVSSNFVEGGFITLFFKDLGDEKLETNSSLFRQFINNEITINNKSFTKILLVDNFIKDNIALFLGVFFVFALFSVLLIFNFVIINIKNSTRDIGIYMSLGFSGWKISLIYLFQVLILGIVSFIISFFGVLIFLSVLDAHFTSLSAVDLEIIKMSFLGTSIMLGIALFIPVVAVIIPLYNLSRKNPVDVIKTI